MRPTLLGALFLALGLSSLALAADPCVELLQHQISENRFNTRRGLEKYIDAFPGLGGKLDDLPTNGHWIDSGGGEGHAIRQFVAGRTGRLPRTTLISYVVSMPTLFSPSTKLIIGKYFEDIPPGELESADIITDLFGVFSYTPNKDSVLTTYLNLLKPNGTLFLHTAGSRIAVLRPKKSTTGERSTIERIPFEAWLDEIPGIQVIRTFANERRPDTFRITRSNGQNFSVPKLKMIDSDQDTPPRQVYIEVDETDAALSVTELKKKYSGQFAN